MSILGWPVEHHDVGSAAAFHQLEVPDPPAPVLWWFDVAWPALVLGSTQRDEIVDHEAAAAAGVEVARRRSGGGAVHLVPGAVTWIDVVLPVTDPRWTADVGRSFDWLGQAWSRVVAELGFPDATAYEGPLLRRPWSELVCFAGLGPGEVTVGERKVVGISQRRTRAAARYQCALLHRWDPAALVGLLALDDIDRKIAIRELEPLAMGVGDVAPARVVELLRLAVRAPAD
ncbi:lipoyl protein ligase domain-containing protein [Aquihabitans sp. McL0605]|uniref:lipoyl protein ligase domain-containing protein n=1 Tax=Aquihabitans sp. McL0605 TaxID=3415671 RepID=UPI003CEF6D42